MQTKVRFIITLTCLLATSCSSSSNAPLPTVIATETPTSIPTSTITPSPTNTPKPTETFTPISTETPGPYWLTPFGEFPHAINDFGQETFNFLAPFEDWLHLPDITPPTIKAYHDALMKINLSDGLPLVKLMNTEELMSLPALNWRVRYTDYSDNLMIGNENYGDRNNLPVRFIGGFVYSYPGG